MPKPRTRKLCLTLITFAIITSARLALPAEPAASAPKVTITSPADDTTPLFINETLDMTAKLENAKPLPKDKAGPFYTYVGASQVPANYTVAWTCTMGNFMECYAPTTTFMNVSEANALTIDLQFFAAAVDLNGAPAKAASAPASSPSQPRVEQKPLLPSPSSKFLPTELKDEIAAAMSAADRDARVERLRSVLARRANDPWAIVMEFNIATLLAQNPDAEHHQDARPLEAIPVLEHIIKHYDHKIYYNADPLGETCSPRYMVPRAAVMAASIQNGLLYDGAAARALALSALDNLDWTFQKRTADWLNAPRPEPMPAAFGAPMEDAKFQSRVAAWEKCKADALAGKAIGPYEKDLAQAAVRQYGLSFGPQRPHEAIETMKSLITKYPASPIAAAAQTHIDVCRKMLEAGQSPTSAPSST